MGNEQTAEKAAGNSAGNGKAAAVKGAGAAKAGESAKAGAVQQAGAPIGRASTSEGVNRPREKMSPEALKKIAQMRDRMQGLLGQVVMALSAVPRYRHQTLADLHHLVVEPLMRDRIAIASAAPRGEGESEGQTNPALEQLAGIAFWASVSDAVDAKIREQVMAGAFPIRLKPDEWASGDTIWLLDVIAPSQKLATAVLANFSKVLPKKDGEAGGQSRAAQATSAARREQGDPAQFNTGLPSVDKNERAAPSETAAHSANSSRETNQVRIHPIVARQIDPELLKKMGAVAEGQG